MSNRICQAVMLLSLIAGIAGLEPRDAAAYCWLPPPYNSFWPSGTTVNVRLNTNMTDICQGYGDGSSSCSDFADIERTVRVAIDEFNDASAANITLRYAGTTSASPGTLLTDTIHIYAVENISGNPVARTELGDNDADVYTDWALIRINDDYTFSSFLSTSGVWPLHGIISS